MMNEKKARQILTDARAEFARLVDALLEVFALVGHEHEASEIIVGKDETLDEALETLWPDQDDEDELDGEDDDEG